jgi:hypothetical protein
MAEPRLGSGFKWIWAEKRGKQKSEGGGWTTDAEAPRIEGKP